MKKTTLMGSLGLLPKRKVKNWHCDNLVTRKVNDYFLYYLSKPVFYGAIFMLIWPHQRFDWMAPVYIIDQHRMKIGR